jgi:hypothetical protein
MSRGRRERTRRDLAGRAASHEHDDAIGVGIWQRPEEDAVHDAVGGGRGVDADGQREDGGDRERSVAAEAANRVPDVLPDRGLNH